MFSSILEMIDATKDEAQVAARDLKCFDKSTDGDDDSSANQMSFSAFSGDGDDEDEYSDGDEMNDGKENDRQAKSNSMQQMKENKNNEHMENQNHLPDVSINGVNNKKIKSIIIEDTTHSISLDEMKNMPVNSLRTLAKNKLNNIDVPTINKMSKKDILKALHE
jgi:hypothetical protein